ncbi:MAG: substrate-binding domain-containing protein, partial [Pseudomonadota bacterium]
MLSMALGCYEALKGRWLVIPDDVSVVGFDDVEVSRHLFPQLTTLILPHRGMGRWAIETLLEGQNDPQSGPLLTEFECELVER